MKGISQKIQLVFMVLILASCNTLADKPTSQAPTPSVPPTQIPSPAAPMTPVTLALENGLTWTECNLPDGEYSSANSDLELIAQCLDLDFPSLGDNDKRIFGERIEGTGGGDNFRLVIGSDTYETKYTVLDATTYDYELLKNGTVIAQTKASFFVFPPNRNLANIGGKAVWEIVADPPAIIVDGVNFTETHQLEGSFFPYEIKGKLLYIAQKGGKYSIVYNNKVIGPEFDQISMAYCCAEMTVFYGQGQYWFLGSRDGKQFAVAIR